MYIFTQYYKYGAKQNIQSNILVNSRRFDILYILNGLYETWKSINKIWFHVFRVCYLRGIIKSLT